MVAASSSLRPGTCTNIATMSASGGRSMKAADGLAIAAAARQLAQSSVKKRPSVRQHHQLVGGLGVNPETGAVAFAVFDRLGRFLMALERAQPAFFRADDGDAAPSPPPLASSTASSASADSLSTSLALGDFGAALAELGLAAELGVDRLHLLDQPFGLQLVGPSSFLQFLLLLGQRVVLAADLHLLQLAQGAQAHVEDRLGLHSR